MPEPFGVESPGFVAIRALLSIATVAVLGAVAFRVSVFARYAGPQGELLREQGDAALQQWVRGFAALAVMATVAKLFAQQAAVFGTEEAPTAENLATLLFRAAWGRSWWIGLAGACAAAVGAARLGTHRRAAWSLTATGALALAASQPLSGHPAATATPMLSVGLQLLHLVAAGGWVGSLAVFLLVAIPAARAISADDADASIAHLARAFSPTALVFAALLAATGVVRAWQELGSLDALVASSYGQTLLAKLAVLGVVLATGAYNWQRVLPVLGTTGATRRLRISAAIEVAAAIAVLIVTAALVATPLPGE